MAGKKGRSGRRPIVPPVRLQLPPLGESELEIARYLAAVADGVRSGRIDARIGDTLVSAARVALTAIKRVAEGREIEQLESMYERAEQLARGVQQSATAGPLRQS